MAAAVNALITLGGGEVVVKNGKVIAAVPFPIAGLFSNLSMQEVVSGVLRTFWIDYPTCFRRSRNKTTDLEAPEEQVVL